MRCKKCGKLFDDAFKFCPYCGASAAVKRRQIKRANGSGTIFKRSDVKSKPWVAMTPAVRDEYGVLKQQTIGNFSTAQEAKDALENFRQNPTTRINITVSQIYAEWQELKFRTVGDKQREAYELSWKKLKDIYNIKFKELRTAQMQRIVDSLAESYSLSALQKIKVLLGQLYQYAMQNDIVNKNYADFIILPKESKQVKACFGDLDIEKLKQAAQHETPNADLILIMCYTGHRIGEFLSLTRFDVIIDNDMMFLRGGNKTTAGKNKVVPVSPVIRKYVNKWLSKNGETIFCRDDGKPYSAKYFREKCYYPALEAVGLPKLSPHATRRTFSTRLAAAGVREDEIIKMMGHTDYSVDVDSYINPEQKTLFEAIKKLS